MARLHHHLTMQNWYPEYARKSRALLSQLRERYPQVYQRERGGVFELSINGHDWYTLGAIDGISRWSFPELLKYVESWFPQLLEKKVTSMPQLSEREAREKGQAVAISLKSVFVVNAQASIVQAMNLGWEIAKWNGYSDADTTRAFAMGFASVFDLPSQVAQIEQSIRAAETQDV